MILRKKNRGLTLPELLLAVFILSVGIVSTLLFFSNAMISTEYARDITVATSHAEYILEETQTRDSLINITLTDWASWAQNEGLNSLPHETFNVSFTNMLISPIDIETTVSWMRRARTYNVTLTTKLAR